MFHSGDCGRRPDFAAAYAGVGPIGASAREAGLASMAAIPVLEAGRLKAVVGLYF